MMLITNQKTRKRTKKYGIADDAIQDAIFRIRRGLVDATLGDGLVKQRIARGNRGLSHGCRGIFVIFDQDLFLLVDMFAKSEKENLTTRELEVFKDLASALLQIGRDEILRLAKDNHWSIETYGP